MKGWEISALFLVWKLMCMSAVGFGQVTTSLCSFLVKGKGWMTFLALVSFDRRRQFEMKRCKHVGQFYNQSPFCHLSQAHSRSQTPSAFKGCLLLCVKHFCTFTSQVTRPFSSEWRKRSGFVGGKERVWNFLIRIHPETALRKNLGFLGGLFSIFSIGNLLCFL